MAYRADSVNPDSASSVGGAIFGDAGPRMRRAGFAVLPADGKSPLMAGFNRWKYAPGSAAVERWAARNPEADLVYVPGLSHAKRGDGGLVVVDGDDAEACGRIVETFGDTPGKVRTRRGRHYLYRASGSLGTVQSLKAYGLNADIKHGRSIVVAPPSRHQDERTFAYTWDGCDESVIRDLPPFDARALQALFDRAAPRPEPQPATSTASPSAGIKGLIGQSQNSRGLALNRFLCGQLASCETEDHLRDHARMFDDALAAAGIERLPMEEIMMRTAAVWRDYEAGKLEAWAGARAVARTDAEEVKDLCSYKGGGDAMALLMLLRAEHGARVLRGETFALNVEAMEKCRTLDWSAERFAKARDVLIAAGYIKIVASGRNSRAGRRATQYTLVPRMLSAVRAAFE